MNPSNPPRRRVVLAGLAIAATARPLRAQDGRWPDKPVTIFVPSAAGGAADFAARTFGNFVQGAIPGAVVLVENRAGAGGILGTLAAKTAPADGHHFLLSTNSTHAANVALYAKLGYDPEKDFEPVGMFGKFGTVLMVRTDAPMKSLPELIALAKAQPGKLSFGYYSSSSQVPAELLKSRARIDAVAIAYKNITQIVTDLIGGQIDFAFMDMLSASPALQNQRLRPIGVSAPAREPSLPQVPTVAEVIPGYELQGWLGLHAPAGTPKAAIDRVGRLMAQAVAQESVKKALESRGMVVGSMPAQEMAEFVRQDVARWAEWIRLAGIKPQ